MEREQVLISFLTTLTSSATGEGIEAVNSGIQELQENPDAALVYSNVLMQIEQKPILKAAATLYLQYIRQAYSEIPPEIQNELENALIEIFRKIQDYEIRTVLAEIVSIIFKAKIFWKEIMGLIVELFTQKQIPASILLLYSIIEPMEGPTIHELWEGLRNIALAGLVQPSFDTKFMAVEIFFEIYKLEQNIEVLIPVFNLFLNLLDSYKTIPPASFSTLWQKYIRRILKLKTMDADTILEFLTQANQEAQDETLSNSVRCNIISSLTNVIPKMSEEMIAEFLQQALQLGTAYIAEHQGDGDVLSQQPSDILDFIGSCLQIKVDCSSPLVKEAFMSMIQEEEAPQQAMAVYLIGLLLQYSSNDIIDEMDDIESTLKEALSSEDMGIILAALLTIEKINESEAQSAQISRGLMEGVLPYLTNETPEIRVLAYHCMQSLCEVCENPVENLFETVWGIHTEGQLADDDTDVYLSLLSQVIKLSPNFSDEFVESIIAFCLELLTSDRPETTKAAVLSILSVLIEHDETIPTRIPDLDALLQQLIVFQNDDVIAQVLNFLRNIAFVLRVNSLDHIHPYFETINAYLTNQGPITTPRTFSTALSTASLIIKYTGDRALLDPVCTVITQFFTEDPETEILKDACETLNLIAKALAPIEENESTQGLNETNKERSHLFFEKVISVIDEEIDVDLLEFAFDACRHLLKYCKAYEPEFYIQTANEVAQRIIEGEINYCAGSPPQETEFQTELIKTVMYFFYELIKSHDEFPAEILEFIITWMQEKQEAVDPVLGTLSDIISIGTVDESLISQILEFCKGQVETSDPLLQHNLVTFLTRAAKAYPQSLPAISEFVPVIDGWWANEEGKDGYSETISNFASLYLLMDIDDERNMRALKAYPPSDVTESNFMSETLLNFISAKERSPEIVLQITVCIADVLTESASMAQKRKLRPEIRTALIELLKSILAQDEQKMELLMQHYETSQKRREDLAQILA